MKTNRYLLKVALALKLSKLGFDTAICHCCGKIFERSSKDEVLCKDCQERAGVLHIPNPFSVIKCRFADGGELQN